MGEIDDLWRYDGRRVVVTGCASGIGEHVARQLTELGAEVVGLDRRRPAAQLKEFHEIDLAEPASIDRTRLRRSAGNVDSLFNIAGVSSGIGDPLLVVTINFLGMRHLTEAVLPAMPSGSSVACVSSLAAAGYLEHKDVDRGTGCKPPPSTRASNGVIATPTRSPTGATGCPRKRSSSTAWPTRFRWARGASAINCTAPGVTDTPILDQLRSAYGAGLSRHHPQAAGPCRQSPPSRRQCWCS